MTSPAQVSANRPNARRSTGPRSGAGKARAAHNARRHGLTAAPDPTQVETWLRVILGCPDLSLRDVLEADEQMHRALALARAEAACMRARGVLRFEQDNPDPPCTEEEFRAHLGRVIADEAPCRSRADMAGHREGRGLADLKDRIAQAEARRKQLRLLERYVREAEGARRRAFRDWLAGLAQMDVEATDPQSAQSPVSRNEAVQEPIFPKRSQFREAAGT